MLNITPPEEWRAIPGLAYEAGDHGHIRRRPLSHQDKKRYVKPHSNTDGRQIVTLKKGSERNEYFVDELVCRAFHTRNPVRGMVVTHIDGIEWNDWPSNLRWSFNIMAAKWYCGKIKDAAKGFYRAGPFSTPIDLSPHTEFGDIIVAYDTNNEMVAFEFVLGRAPDERKNPYALARYYRMMCNTLMEIERTKGLDIMIDKDANPFEAAQRYHHLADLHPEFMWAKYLHEAAFFLERMASIVYGEIEAPAPRLTPMVRQPLKTPAPEAPLPVPVRRPLGALPPAPAPSPPPMPARRPLAPPRPAPDPRRTPSSPGFFTKG